MVGSPYTVYAIGGFDSVPFKNEQLCPEIHSSFAPEALNSPPG